MAHKLLIVDDEADTLRLISLMLERQGYSILTAKDGKTALNIIVEERPDLILLDVMMPEIDGIEVVKIIRANPDTEDIPVIMFTARSQVEDKISGLEAGADVYLTKPTQPRELFAQIKSILSRSQKIPADTSLESPSTRGFMLGVLSAKGGLGVSTVATNLGIMIYHQTKAKVVVADLQPGNGGISMSLGYLHPDGLTRLLESDPKEISKQSIKMSLTNHSSGVQFLLASPQPKDGILLSKISNFETITNNLPLISGYIILDLGSSLPPITQITINQCDELIVVLEPTRNNVQQTRKLLQDLSELGIGEGRIHNVLVNRLRSSSQMNWTQIQDELGYKISNVFTPAPELAYQSAEANQPMVISQPGSITAQQFDKLAALITSQR